MSLAVSTDTHTTPVARPPSVAKPAPKPPRTAEYYVEEVSIDQLQSRVAEWDELARHAVEPNPFQESWMLIPALQTFGQRSNLTCLLVYWFTGRPQDPREPTLCGLFVMEKRSRHRGLPVKTWSLFKHDYGFLGTPLVHRGHAVSVLTNLFDWFRNQPQGPALLDWQLVHGQGGFQQALIDATRQSGLTVHSVDLYNRALLLPASDSETYMAAAMTCHNRQELRRQRRRLAEQGKLEVRILREVADLESWIEIFLSLEGCGWKGQEETALRADPTHRAYFQTIARAAFERGQLMLLGLFLDGRPIAVKCNFKAGDGAFAFKIGFDESLSRFSPGVQLELENIQLSHETPGLKWMDSCAAPVHFMINRLWSDRRTVQKVLISTGRRSGELLLGLLPFWRGLKRFCLGPQRPAPKSNASQETKTCPK